MSSIVSRETHTESEVLTAFISTIDQGESGAYVDRPTYFVNGGYTTLSETYTPNSDGDRTKWKAFQHYKRVATPLLCPGRIRFTTNAYYKYSSFAEGFVNAGNASLFCEGQFGVPGNTHFGLPVFYDPLSEDKGFVPFPADIGAWQSNSMRAMMPYIKGELSVLNSVYELKDFKTLPNQVRSVGSLIGGDLAHSYLRVVNPTLWKILRKIPPGATLRTYLRESASGYLQAKFNILPLISDIQAIIRSVEATCDRIRDLINRQGKPRIAHFTKQFMEFDNVDETSNDVGMGYDGLHPGWNPSAIITGTSKCHRQVIYKPSTFHAEVEYNYNYTNYQAKYASLLAFLDRIGVNLNPRIIWNAIPWSFVVDWVVGIGRLLDDFRKGWMDPEINILRYLWSISRRRDIFADRLIRFKDYLDGPMGEYHPYPLPTLTETAYRRVVEWPTRASLFASGLNSNEFTLGAALVIARKRHRKRKS